MLIFGDLLQRMLLDSQSLLQGGGLQKKHSRAKIQVAQPFCPLACGFISFCLALLPLIFDIHFPYFYLFSRSHWSFPSPEWEDQFCVFLVVILTLNGWAISPSQKITFFFKDQILKTKIPRCLILCTLSSCGSLYLFPFTAEEASLVMAEQDTDLSILQNVIRRCFITVFL